MWSHLLLRSGSVLKLVHVAGSCPVGLCVISILGDFQCLWPPGPALNHFCGENAFSLFGTGISCVAACAHYSSASMFSL